VATVLPDEVCLHVGVIDTGIGIPSDKQQVVFEAFGQADASAARRFGGTGLGLSISRRLVELMRGDLWVESEAGEGSTFRFTATFRINPSPEEPADDRAAAPAVADRSFAVLIAEDEPVHRELLESQLRSRGHSVVSATDGREALQELARSRVDVLLLDLQMPSVDGLQVAASIRAWERETGGHLPIVGMSASVASNEDARCLAAGIDRFVAKPVSRAVLFDVVETLAARARFDGIPAEVAGRPSFLASLGEDLELARRLVDIFLVQSPVLLQEIRAAIDSGDAVALRRSVHALKGTISNFPPGPARAVATRMEAIGFDEDFAAARATLPLLEQELERLKTVLPALI
jgi:CheY-like chemotaxis protein